MLLAAFIWVSENLIVASNSAACFFPFVILSHHLFKGRDLFIQSSDTIKDDTAATSAPLSFLSAYSWLLSWSNLTEALFPVTRCNIFAKGGTMAFIPSSWASSPRSELKISHLQECVVCWSRLLINRALICAQSCEMHITIASKFLEMM